MHAFFKYCNAQFMFDPCKMQLKKNKTHDEQRQLASSQSRPGLQRNKDV